MGTTDELKRPTYHEILELSRSTLGIADEYSISPPVPIDQTRLVSYAYLYRRGQPGGSRLKVPNFKVTIEHPTRKVIGAIRVSRSDLGIPEDVPDLGVVRLAERYKLTDSTAQRRTREEFHASYTELVDHYMNTGEISESPCSVVGRWFPVHFREPLLPVLRRTSPTFLAHLERCAARSELNE